MEELLERDSELAELRRAIAESALGRGKLILVGGEAGVGKSALVAAFCRHDQGTFRVFVGHCDPLTTPRPLGPLFDISRLVGKELVDLLESGDRASIVFGRALHHLSARPSVVVFEDVHWADEATLDFIRFLGRRVGDTCLLFICTYRDDETDARHPLTVALGDLSGVHHVRRVALAPLSKAAVASLSSRGGAHNADSLFALTGGNPFFVTEVLASGARRLPASIRDAVHARAARLSMPGREALDAASVIGQRVDPGLLATVTNHNDAAVAQCLASGLLVAVADQLAFRNQLAREAILDGVPIPIKARLHARLMNAMRSRGISQDDLAVLSDHAENIGDAESVLEFAPAAAARAASLGAHREAAAQYARAVRFLGAEQPSREARLIEDWAYQAYMSGDNALSAELRTRAAMIWRSLNNHLKEADNLRWRSRILMRLGHYAESFELAKVAIEVLEVEGRSPELLWAYANMAHILCLSDQYSRSLLWSDKALKLANDSEDEELLIHALNDRGIARLWLGQEEGRHDLETSGRLAADAGYEEHFMRAQANLAAYSVEHYRPQLADDYLDVGIAYSDEHELDDLRTHLLGIRAMTRLMLGSWPEAAELARVTLGYGGVVPVTRFSALAVIGRICSRTGDLQGAQKAFHDAKELSTRQLPSTRWHLHSALAESAWLRGDQPSIRKHAWAAVQNLTDKADYQRNAECYYWLWRSGEPIQSGVPMDGPFALQLSGNWRAGAREWQERGCPFERGVALLDSNDISALMEALENFERLGAKPAVAMTKRKLRALGVTKMRRGPTQATRANRYGLTTREAEILTLVANGYTNNEIAARLFIAAKTVEHHVSSVLAKVGASNRTEAVRLATSERQSARSTSEEVGVESAGFGAPGEPEMGVSPLTPQPR